MTEREYNEAPGIRRTALWRMRESPEKYKWYLEHHEPDTPALIFGAAVHKLLLEPEEFTDEYIAAPIVDRRTKAGKEEWDKFLAQAEGRTVIPRDDFEQAKAMAQKVLTVPLAKKLITGLHEVPIFWTDEETGMPCKARLDILRDGWDGNVAIADYKTAACAETNVFNSKIFSLGYHMQAYMYAEGARKALGLARLPEFYFIAQEKKEPYAVNVIRAGEDVLEAGKRIFRELMDRLKECQETDYWYGYNGLYGEANEAYLPGYMLICEDEE